jgi:hypothetical protein
MQKTGSGKLSNQHVAVYKILFAIIFLLAAAIRLANVIKQDFPIHDGGLFFSMIRDLQLNHFSLPWYTSYNSDHIPYLYPPLGFYLAGIIDQYTSLDLFQVLRYLPALITILTVPAFYWLANDLLDTKLAAVFALLAYTLMPDSYRWLVMGGGLTRSFGALFCLLALHQIYQVLKTGKPLSMILAVLFSSLTALSHPESIWFLAYSTIIYFLMFNRHWKSFWQLAIVALSSLLVISPWLITILIRHQHSILAPFSSGEYSPLIWLFRLFTINYISGEVISVWSIIGLVGLLWNIWRRNYFLPVWFLSILLLQSRGTELRLAIVLALAAGQIAAYLITTTQINLTKKRKQNLIIVLLVLLVLLNGVLALYGGPAELNTSINNDELQAMQWIKNNTLPSSHVLVIPPTGWFLDEWSEWLPVLAERKSVSVIQGYEWTPTFHERYKRHKDLLNCILQGAACIEAWIQSQPEKVDYIYLPEPFLRRDQETDGSPGLLTESLTDFPGYQLVYENSGAMIIERKISDTP